MVAVEVSIVENPNPIASSPMKTILFGSTGSWVAHSYAVTRFQIYESRDSIISILEIILKTVLMILFQYFLVPNYQDDTSRLHGASICTIHANTNSSTLIWH